MRALCGLFIAACSVVSAQVILVPSIDLGGVVDAASFAKDHPVAAGSMVAIFGSQLSGPSAIATATPLPYAMADNVSVTFNGMAAPVQYVSPEQINAQVPWNVLPAGVSGTVNVVVTRSGVSSLPEPVLVSQFAPGVYAASGHAFAINVTDPASDRYGSFAAPVGSLPGYPAFPAHAGDALLIYASGLGAVDAPITDGATSSDVTRKSLTFPAVLIGNVPAVVTFHGLSPQYPGVYQVNILVPFGLPGKTVPLQIQIAGLTTSDAITIAIE